MSMNHASAAERASNLWHDRAYWRKHPERRAAGRAVERALAAGKIERCPCWVCGELKVEAHHADYGESARLSVVWLCNRHHRQVHAMVNGGAKVVASSSQLLDPKGSAPPPSMRLQ